MSDYAITITHERDDDSGEWFYQCVIANTTNGELRPQNVAIGLLDGIAGEIRNEAYQNIERLRPGETAILRYEPNAKWKYRQFVRITVAGEASEFLVTGPYSDPVVGSKVRPTRNHAVAFLKRHAFVETIAIAVAILITAVPTFLSADAIKKASEGYGLRLLSIELAWVIFGLPLLIYVGWLVISGMMAKNASSTTAHGTVTGGSINLTIHEGSASTANLIQDTMGVGKLSVHRKVFFFGFCLNAAIIAYQLLHGVMKGETSIVSGILSCSLFLTTKSMQVFFAAKPIIDTGFKNINVLLALAEYALVVAFPIVLLKLTKERVAIQQKVTSAFWGLLFGFLLAQLPAWLTAR
ncbi:MAG TPA: hypothetical protein PKL75_11000 [Treponemataceae bacterium]|nr:hypothetical protein [Treponemataceae bacterium]